jgi:hypothetical protein
MNRSPSAISKPRSSTLAFVLLTLVTLNLSAQDPPETESSDFSRFKILTERNIFNPNRSGRAAPTVTRPTSRAPQVDSFTLVGTLGDGGLWTAFFDGTRSEFRGRLRQHDTIGDYTLAAISNSGVQLDNGTNSLHLRVGMQLRREDNGPWLLAERGESSNAQRTSSNRQDAISTASARSEGPDNDVLLRLRQQREKELQ